MGQAFFALYSSPQSVYACVNRGEAFCPREIQRQSICINGDISWAISYCLCRT